MVSWSSITVVHLIGLALAMGAATVKVVLLLRCGSHPALLASYLDVVRPVTRVLILGLVLLTLSGIAWLVIGYAFTPRLVVKLVLVAAIWILGPVIDRVAEPAFRRLAPVNGMAASPDFARSRSRYLALELVATLLFYVVVAVWVLD